MAPHFLNEGFFRVYWNTSLPPAMQKEAGCLVMAAAAVLVRWPHSPTHDIESYETTLDIECRYAHRDKSPAWLPTVLHL